MTAPLSFFCDECGAANPLHASSCFACRMPLASSVSSSSSIVQIMLSTPPTPVIPAPVAQPGIGTLLHGRYKLMREIGQGGFGVVYLARDKQTRRRVAVKQINIGKLRAREVIDATDSYNREVMLLSKLKHARLPRLHDHFTDPEHWYLVMDYIKGQTLEESLQATPGKALPVKQVIAIGIQLCKVLDYLHNLKPPVIFRDVKPANIMRTPRGKIYLIDFGIARRFNAGRIKDTGSLGSPGYAAPEQYGTTQTNTHTDIYGLGATLQTLMTGREPQDLQASLPMPSATTRQQQQLYRLLNQMLEKESSKRPPTVRKVKEALEDLRYGSWRFARSPFWGFLLGFGPYALFMFLAANATFGFTFALPLLLLLYCFWPFIFAAQLIVSIVFLFTARKRLIGLGMLIGLALFILGLVLHQAQLSLYLQWPGMGD
jgi:hypothetical protein